VAVVSSDLPGAEVVGVLIKRGEVDVCDFVFGENAVWPDVFNVGRVDHICEIVNASSSVRAVSIGKSSELTSLLVGRPNRNGRSVVRT